MTANPEAGYVFTGWSGNPIGTENPVNITMVDNKTITGTFEPIVVPTYTVTFNLDRKGTRTGGGTLTQTVAHGGAATEPTVTANTGYSFANCSGSASGTANPVSITMDGNKAVTANFTQKTYTLGITATNGSVTKRVNRVVTTATSFAHGTVVSEQSASLTNAPKCSEGWVQEHFVRLGSAQQAFQIPMSACNPQTGTVALWVTPQASDDTQYLFGHAFNNANRIAP